jgi:formate-nitrite transporter family protein
VSTRDGSGARTLAVPVGAGDHQQGRADAPLTLLEYGDFQCPHCGHAYPIIKELQRRLGDDLRFVFRHFPLTSAHPFAQRAAETAEWAGAAGGAFWRMHDRLYEHQDALREPDLEAHARALGLDPGGLRRAWGEFTFVRRLKDDLAAGIRSGVGGTPSFFINGRGHDGPWQVDDLLAALARAPRG